ncbi:helix-turn-helix domain-containing protein [Aminobacter sp. LjRoot7]|uniref:AraC-like ligand-binding domain-containing protein n=1 Tax=Aminobacter sp. LjRoot7 TaxID=3342335 RepID=UPI003ED0F157
MITVLSTDAVDPTARFTSFQQAICQIADLSAHRSETDAYHAKIRKSRVGFLDCSFVDCESVVIERSLANIGRDNGKDYLLALQIDGSGVTRHIGRDVRLMPGDFTIVDATLPYSVEFDGPVRRVVVRFPRNEFVQRGLSTDRLCGHVFRGESGASGLASQILGSLAADRAGIGPQAGYSLAAAILDLIADSEPNDDSSRGNDLTQSHDHLIRRIRSIVLVNLSDPELSVSFVAAKAGISVRYLHKLFSATGTTLHKWIENERLDRCYRTLQRLNQRSQTIQDIAFANGFNDPGYFSHRFTRKYGKSPRQVRMKAL